MRIDNLKNNSQGGFTIIEASLALIVATISITAALSYYNNYLDSINNQVTADHLQVVSKASKEYIKDNYSALIASAGPTTPASITTAMLKSTNYLPAGFSDTNLFGQRYQISVIEPVANRLDALVTTDGGAAINELSIRRIAHLVGASGGYISNTNTTIVHGSFGGWQSAISNYAINPGAGRLAVGLFFENGQYSSDYLYRNVVPGHPELNQMNTSIAMSGNNITGAGVIGSNSVTTQTVSATGIGTSTITATSGAIGNLNATNLTSNNGSISSLTSTTATAGTITATNLNAANAAITGSARVGGQFVSTANGGWYSENWGGGWFMQDATWIRAYGNKNIYTAGTVLGGSLTSSGRVTAGEYVDIQSSQAWGGGCSPNGLLTKNTNGQLMICRSGSWQNSGRQITLTNLPYFSGMTAAATGVTYTNDLGYHHLCVVSRVGDAQGGVPFVVDVTPQGSPDAVGRYQWIMSLRGQAYSSASASCITAI